VWGTGRTTTLLPLLTLLALHTPPLTDDYLATLRYDVGTLTLSHGLVGGHYLAHHNGRDRFLPTPLLPYLPTYLLGTLTGFSLLLFPTGTQPYGHGFTQLWFGPPPFFNPQTFGLVNRGWNPLS